MVIVPIDKLDIFRNQGADRPVDLRVFRIVLSAAGKPEEHIRPHTQPDAMLFSYLGNAVQMLQQHLCAVCIAVLIIIPAATHMVRFVHADMHCAGAEAGRHGIKHLLDQCIDRFITGQQNVVDVKMRLVGRPALQGIQMCKRLNTRNQPHTVRCRVVVQLSNLLHAVTSATVTEIRFTGNFISVLGIEHQRVITHCSRKIDPKLHRLRPHDCISGTIDHCSVSRCTHFLSS